jgi:ABC-type multidrug transport system fused ATPase/permease subunit
MLRQMLHLYQLLDRAGRSQAVLLVALSLVGAGLDLAGVTSTVPFMAMATNPDLVNQPGSLHRAYLALGSPDPQSFLIGFGVLAMATLTFSNLLAALTMTLGLRFSHEQQKRLSVRLFQSQLSRGYQWHEDQHVVDLGQALGQARRLVETNFQPLLMALTRVFNVILLLSALLYFNTVITLCGLGLVVSLYWLVYSACRKNLIDAGQREWQLNMEVGRTLSEPFGGLKHIKLAALESTYLARYAEQMHTLMYGALLSLVIYLVSRYGGGTEVVGRAALFALAGYRLIPGVQQIFSSLGWFEAGRPALDQLYPHLRLDPPELPPCPPAMPIQTSVALEDVNFAYGSHSVFTNLNLSISKNTTVGLVGSTGSGKTTLVNLLAGLLRPQAGGLRVDGQLLDEEHLRGYGQSLGYVPQDVFLTDDTVFANIALGVPEVNEEWALRAARAARVDEFADQLQHGYHTRIGERGARLSGGQRQRIGIARALYREPEFLLLDEATSALDGETENQVMQAIRSFARAKEKTIVIVAHRLTTVKDCDIIYVLGAGGIVDQGTYLELVRSSPEFMALAPELRGES